MIIMLYMTKLNLLLTFPQSLATSDWVILSLLLLLLYRARVDVIDVNVSATRWISADQHTPHANTVRVDTLLSTALKLNTTLLAKIVEGITLPRPPPVQFLNWNSAFCVIVLQLIVTERRLNSFFMPKIPIYTTLSNLDLILHWSKIFPII